MFYETNKQSHDPTRRGPWESPGHFIPTTPHPDRSPSFTFDSRKRSQKHPRRRSCALYNAFERSNCSRTLLWNIPNDLDCLQYTCQTNLPIAEPAFHAPARSRTFRTSARSRSRTLSKTFANSKNMPERILHYTSAATASVMVKREKLKAKSIADRPGPKGRKTNSASISSALHPHAACSRLRCFPNASFAFLRCCAKGQGTRTRTENRVRHSTFQARKGRHSLDLPRVTYHGAHGAAPLCQDPYALHAVGRSVEPQNK